MIDPSDHVARALAIRCPKCDAGPGQMCRSTPSPPLVEGLHARRVFLATEGVPMPRNPLDAMVRRRRGRDDDY